MIEKSPSCEDTSEPGLIPVETALLRIQSQLPAPDVADAEEVPLEQALDRILAKDLTSPINVPGYTNSAMDGYAIASKYIPANGQTATLRVAGTAWAGRPFGGDIDSNTPSVVRIMTGAMMPATLDTVVIQEHVETSEDGEIITIDSSVKPGNHVRHTGEDIKQGETVLQAGALLGPAHLGQLASLGINRVLVYRRLKVAFFTTGDELRSLDTHAGKELAPGELFDSNRHTLRAMLQRLGAEVIDLGIVADDPEETRNAFQQAAAMADLIVTSGGVSAGQADFVTRIIHEIGEVGFWKLAMRPGRPLAFGKLGDAVFFGLPGNPVAVMVAFYEFVQPAIMQMSGASNTQVEAVSAICLSALRKSPGRTEYQRGVLSLNAEGASVVETTGKQGAGRLTSMVSANCLIILPPEVDSVTPGQHVLVRPFFGMV